MPPSCITVGHVDVLGASPTAQRDGSGTGWWDGSLIDVCVGGEATPSAAPNWPTIELSLAVADGGGTRPGTVEDDQSSTIDATGGTAPTCSGRGGTPNERVRHVVFHS